MAIKFLVIVGACICAYVIIYAIVEIYRDMKETEALMLVIKRGAERAIKEVEKMKPLNELPSTRSNEDPNTEKRKKEILDFLACGAEFCELEMFDKDKPKTVRPQIERGKYERAIRLLEPQTGYGLSYARGKRGLKLFQRDYKLYCQRTENQIKEVF